MRTKNCTDCSNEGLDLKLTGSSFLLEPTKCSTHHLDHELELNEGPGNTTVFIASVDAKDHVRFGWNTCWKVKGK